MLARLIRLIVLFLLFYLLYRFLKNFWRHLKGEFPVRGKPKGKESLDLKDEDVEDADYEDIE
ncbi:hypothetical protein ISS37_10755 [candidate division KSB1 bacterium]|nr:hypothetical protein [candidate division KSB1 bacterium]